MKNLTTLDQLSTLKNTTITNPVAVLKHSYNLDRILEIENKGQIAMQLIKAMKKDIALKGIKDSPRDEILDDVIKMILKKFQYLTPLEIEVALEMERYGEFDEKTIHYQFYGTEYIADVLRKYVLWKQQKAIELNLSRKVHQVEFKPDIKAIEKEYLETILNDIKEGKILRFINAHQLYKDIPEDEKMDEERRKRLHFYELRNLSKENETKKLKEKDAVKLKNITEILSDTFDVTLTTRCMNVATCIWLAEKNGIEINKDQF